MHNGIPNWVQELLNKEETFWQQKYPNFSFDEKVSHWSSVLHRKMRWQAESGLDPYAVYGKDWYQNTKRIEPMIDEIMDILFSEVWKNIWNKSEYMCRITR